MSCGCSSGSSYDGGIYGGVCNTDTPYPSVSHESVPSLIDNLVYALYGVIEKDVTSGKVVWNIPCDPSNIPATINNIPRNEGEGLLCYIVRALNLTTPSGFVTVNGIQTLTNKTLSSPTITGSGAISGLFTGNLTGTATAAINIAGGLAGSIPYQTGIGLTALLPKGTAGQVLSTNGSGGLGWITNSTTSSSTNNVNGGTAGVVVYQTGVNTTGFTAAGTSGQVLVSNGTSAPTWSTNIAGQAGSVANGSVTPAKLSTGGLSWDTSGNVGIGTSTPTSDLQIVDGTRILRLDANLTPTGNTYISASGSTNGLIIGTTDAKSVSFFTNNTLRASVESSGEINTQGNLITNCPTTAKAWGYVTGLVNTSGAAQSFIGYNVTNIVRGASAGIYTITLTSGTFNGAVVVTPISGSNNAGARVFTYSGNTCTIQMYVGVTATDLPLNFVYFSY